MGHENGRSRILVECASCGAVYPAWKWPDGPTRIIGREACACGSTDLHEVETVDTPPGGENPDED